MARRNAARAAAAGAATTDDEIEEEAIAAGERERANPLKHPDAGEVERAAVAAENAVRVSYRRPA